MKEGHLIILFCVIAYYFAFYFYREQKFHWGAIFIVLSGIIIRVYMGSHTFFMPWDERFHALVAKNMLDNPLNPLLFKNPIMPYDHTNWTASHVWLHKPPLGTWLIALSYKIFGINVWAVRFPSLVLGSLTIYLTYKIGEKLFSPRIGWISAFCFSLIALPISISAGISVCDHIDAPFMAFITWGIYVGILGVQQGKWYFFMLAGVLMGCAILTKWLPGLIVAGVVGIYVMQEQKLTWPKKIFFIVMLIFVGCLVFIPWQIYIFQAYPIEAAFESDYNSKHIFEVVEGHGGNWWFTIENLNFFWSPMLYVFLPLGLTFMAINKEKWRMFAIMGWIFVPVIFFSIVKTKMLGFVLFVYPALAICFGYAIAELSNVKNKWRWIAQLPAYIFVVLTVFYTADFLHLNGKHMKGSEFGDVMIKRTDYIRNVSKIKREKPFIVFNTPDYIEWMFFNNNCHAAYNYPADSLTIHKLKDSGYDVLVLNPGINNYVQQ